jgi:hypothetical protein
MEADMNRLRIINSALAIFAVLLALQKQVQAEVPELVKMHAPILHFHPNESDQCCFPSDAEVAYLRLGPDGSLDELREPKTLLPNTPCFYQLDFNADSFNSLGKVTRIKYWFWYNYNDFPNDLCPDDPGSHAGDWESVEVILVNEQIYIYVLSNHSGSIWVSPQDAYLDNGHINIWVGNGSHANYPSWDYDTYCVIETFGICCDDISEGGSIWWTQYNLKAVDTTNFAGYEGKWGVPVSPVARQYENRIPYDHYTSSYQFTHDVIDCDITCRTWSWGPSCLMRFDPGLKISANCPFGGSLGGCVRLVGEHLACTRLYTWVRGAKISIFNGEIRLYHNGGIRFAESQADGLEQARPDTYRHEIPTPEESK